MLKRCLIAATLLAGPAYATPPLSPHDATGRRQHGDGWVYWRLRNQTDVTTTTHGGIGFEGGGTDVNALYRWLCEKSGNGDVLVLTAYGPPAYNPYIARLCPRANSVATLRITSLKGAHDPFVINTINAAEAVFITGGAQNNYTDWWQNTPVQKALNDLHDRNVAIAGTSAGNAILGRYAFTAGHGTIFSDAALANCFEDRIVLDASFLRLSRLTLDVITDDHFFTRNRMGRLVTFLARISLLGFTPLPRAIATDQNTAFLMDPDGVGHVVGSAYTYFLRTTAAPEVCAPKTPVTNTNIQVYRVGEGDRFDLYRWSGEGGLAYSVSAIGGVLSSTQPGGKIY